MAFVNYTNFSLVVEKNGVEIERGDYSGFAVTTNIAQWVTNDIVSSGTYLSTIGVAYGTASTAFNPWEFYSRALANTSTILKSEGLREILTSVGDILTIYNKNVGSRYALHMRRETDSGTVKRLTLGWTFAGATTWGNTVVFDGIDTNNRSRGFVLGVLRDGYGAYPFYLLSLEPVVSGNKSADFYPWNGFRKTDFRSTYQYNYFFVFSDEWQPPTPPTPSSDPYAEGGTSTPGGAGGSFDDESDEIDVPGVPALNLSLNHFISTYAPTLAQLNDLADFMWSDWLSQGPTLSKIFADPADAIISLHMLPFTPATATAVTVTIGSYSTGVSMDPLTLQFYTIDCGELAIEEYWGNYLDYNPYTKLTLFLPYVGEVTLNPDEVMGQTIGIKYRVDALTGAFVCFVSRADKKIVGQYQGNCALEVPISSANYARLHAALLGLAASAVSAGAAGIAKAAAAKKGAVKKASKALLNDAPEVIDSAVGVMDSKVSHSHSGAIGSAAGFMGSQKPYLIIERARQCLPERLNEFAGYPSQVTATLGDQTGYTSVSEIILDGIPLTDGELSELREILQGGIYV